MDQPSQSIRELAHRLVAAHYLSAQFTAGEAVVDVCLRPSLVELAGVQGFETLLRRGIALATAEAPALAQLRIGADGLLEGFEAIVRLGRQPETDAQVALTSQLLGLLVTFIGESLTRKLVYDAWPAAPDGAPEEVRP